MITNLFCRHAEQWAAVRYTVWALSPPKSTPSTPSPAVATPRQTSQAANDNWKRISIVSNSLTRLGEYTLFSQLSAWPDVSDTLARLLLAAKFTFVHCPYRVSADTYTR